MICSYSLCCYGIMHFKPRTEKSLDTNWESVDFSKWELWKKRPLLRKHVQPKVPYRVLLVSPMHDEWTRKSVWHITAVSVQTNHDRKQLRVHKLERLCRVPFDLLTVRVWQGIQLLLRARKAPGWKPWCWQTGGHQNTLFPKGIGHDNTPPRIHSKEDLQQYARLHPVNKISLWKKKPKKAIFLNLGTLGTSNHNARRCCDHFWVLYAAKTTAQPELLPRKVQR